MSQLSGPQQAQQQVNTQEGKATDAVVAADLATALQATGAQSTTPEQAELLATNAVVNADAMTTKQSLGEVVVAPLFSPEPMSPEQAEQQATQAVAATNVID